MIVGKITFIPMKVHRGKQKPKSTYCIEKTTTETQNKTIERDHEYVMGRWIPAVYIYHSRAI